MASERNYKDPRWYKISDIQENRWNLKENAKGENLEEWQKQEYFLTEFYNAENIIEVEDYKFEEEKLNQVLEFLQMRGLIDSNSEIISLQDGIEAVVKYAETFGADELTKILVMQMWLTEIKINTKLELFLPTYPEEILSAVAEKPNKIFDSMNKAQTILKNLRQEKINPPNEISSKGLFKELMVVYHGSEKKVTTKMGATIPIETILKGERAYEFLFMVKKEAGQKIWIEISYQDYSHGKFLIEAKDYELASGGTVAEFLKKRWIGIDSEF